MALCNQRRLFGLLIVALSLILSGRVVFGFFPAVEGDRVYAA